MAEKRASRPNPMAAPVWVRYEVADLLGRLLQTWDAHCRERDRLESQPMGDRPGQMFAANSHSVTLGRQRELLDLALKAAGPVRFEGRLFTSERSVFEPPIPADPSVQDAIGLLVEIRSPIGGMARKVPPPKPRGGSSA